MTLRSGKAALESRQKSPSYSNIFSIQTNLFYEVTNKQDRFLHQFDLQVDIYWLYRSIAQCEKKILEAIFMKNELWEEC